MTLGQELSGWAAQLEADLARLADTQRRLLVIAQGGTAVGTGLNTAPEFAARFAAALAERTGLAFRPAPNAFAAIGAQDTAVELSGQLRVTAVTLLKIATDLRWMNSGPVAGLGEICLPETPRIGCELAGRIARTALAEGRAVIDVAREQSGLPEAELVQLLDPARAACPHGTDGIDGV